MTIGSVTNDPAALRAAEADGFLRDWDDMATKPRGAPRTPASLLEAHRAVVPFRDRASQLADLEAWWAEPGFGAYLLHGPGGQGKTRLARQLTEGPGGDARRSLWLSPEAPPEGLRLLGDAVSPLLVVVDYAETRTAQLTALLRVGAARREGAFKVLALARTDGEWWEEVRVATRLGDLFDEFPVTLLPPLAPDGAARAETYRQAVTGLAAALPAVPGQQHHDWPARAASLLEAPGAPAGTTGSDAVLDLHMRALVDLLDAARAAAGEPPAGGPPAGGGSPEGPRRGGSASGRGTVEKRLLDHERYYWQAAAKTLRLRSNRTLEEPLAAAFLCGAHDREQARDLLGRVPALRGEGADLPEGVGAWIATLYPPSTDGQVWGSLRPDRLTEYFLGHHLRTAPHLADALLDSPPEARATRPLAPAQAARLLTLYTRAAAHRAHLGHLDDPLADLCERHPRTLGPLAVDVATQVERPDPLVTALERLAADPGATAEEITALADRLPRSTHTLTAVAVDVTRRLAEIHRERYRRDPARSAELVLALRRYCRRLTDAGDRRRAWETADEAVRLLRPLARDEPSAFLPELAAGLHNLSVTLGEVGRREEARAPAREAVEIYRRLVAGSPSSVTLLSELAHGLNALSNAEGETRRTTEALEAIREVVAIRRRLVAEHGDAHRAELADGLNNLALREEGRGAFEKALEAAWEAVGLYRELAEERPDAHLPGLALVLGPYATLLGRTGHHTEALRAVEEAVDVRRRLAAKYPDAHGPGLVSGLNNLAIDLDRAGRNREAATTAREAVELCRGLVERYPAAFRGQLAMSLNTLATRLGDHGRPREALTASREAVEHYRLLVEESPRVHTADLAMSLVTHANRLQDAGHTEEALAVGREGVVLYRSLTPEDLGTNLEGMAVGLDNLSHTLQLLDRPEEALDTAREAVEAGRRLARAFPAGPTRAVLGSALNALAGALVGVGRLDEALTASREAVDFLRGLVREGPDGAAFHSRSLASALTTLRILLSTAGLGEEAVDILRECVEVRGNLSDGARFTHRALYAEEAGLLGGHLLSTARYDEALEPLRRAEELRRELAEEDPATHLPELAGALAARGACLMELGRRREALPPAQESVDLLDGPLRDEAALRPLLCLSLWLVGLLRHARGRRAPRRRSGGPSTRARRPSTPTPRTPPCCWGRSRDSRRTWWGPAVPTRGWRSSPTRSSGAAGRRIRTPCTRPPWRRPSPLSAGTGRPGGDRRGAAPEAALEAAREAVSLYRRLAQGAPQGHTVALADALAARGLLLAGTGDTEEALRVTAEAVALHGQPDAGPLAAREPGLAFVLYAHAKVRLLAGTELFEAERSITEAVRINRRLARGEPGLVAFDLADVLDVCERLAG
ncbi:tetratricopeptide repeat-containing protein [Streptomyces somaliensis]|uniref:tetratricopeptide repeat protein n=1 Tax=Streptomyces somaliensis TaxID=78355 RepID=UPI0020CFBBFB|nr:tetratricopeptide repeat-containing protein [Streptomyces somaliensis]MCP9943675.1 tetratricopeptide repeat-containing protein [Streptomyces somaliensis]